MKFSYGLDLYCNRGGGGGGGGGGEGTQKSYPSKHQLSIEIFEFIESWFFASYTWSFLAN